MTSAGKPIVVSVATLALLACSRANYVYVALTGDNVGVVETGEPPLGFRRFGGDPIPIRYEIREPGVVLELAVANEAFVPSFVVDSPIPIRGASVEPEGSVVPISEFQYKLIWSSVGNRDYNALRVGDAVNVTIDLADRDSPISISGVITQSGAFYYSD